MADELATDPPSLKSYGAADPLGLTQIIFSGNCRRVGLPLDKQQVRL
jgi:hypothetical protein